MKRYDDRILNKLIERYERSSLYQGTNQVHVSIYVPVNRSILPEYFVEGSLEYDIIHDQLENLERQNLIRLVWKQNRTGHILEKCILNTEEIETVYHLLKKVPKNKKEEQVLQICQQNTGKSEILDRFLSWITERVKLHESMHPYLKLEEHDRLELLCQLVYRIVTNQQEIFLRQFSIQWFHDSKLAEKEITAATAIIREFYIDSSMEGLETDDILAEFNIYRNPSWIMIKGYGIFSVISGEKKSEINLSLLDGGIGISNQDLTHIQWNPQNVPEKVITIENLTSFHQWKIKEDIKELCIYLGGYHNQPKREFLRQIYRSYPESDYFHFGDIDCGGFKIWKDLCQKTEIPFQPLFMDLDTFQKYKMLGKELTSRDKKTMDKMVEDPYFEEQIELFQEILKSGKKIEQECVVKCF